MGLAWKSAVKINEKLVNQKYAIYTVLILDALYEHPRIWKAVYGADDRKQSFTTSFDSTKVRLF